MSSPTCFVLDGETHRVVYKAASLAQAQGYVDRRRRPSVIALSASNWGTEVAYRLVMVDARSSQIVAHGPVVNVFDAASSLMTMKIAIVPFSTAPDPEDEEGGAGR